MIEKYSSFSLVVVPSDINTLGASLICDLDKDEDIIDVVGYNAKGNFIISSLAYANLAVPSLNQQEGTFVNIDNKVLPTNVAVGFDGYTLNDVASACGVESENTVDFDSLENFLSPHGDDNRGYLLDEVTCKADGKLDEIDDLPEFNGTIIYHSNPVLQFNAYTNKTAQLERDNTLRGSAQFASAAKIADGDRVEVSFAHKTITREFKLDNELKGTVALNPTFDDVVDASRYRFEKSKIVRVV
jgi:NADH-quinone oxidoreductase subunit G